MKPISIASLTLLCTLLPLEAYAQTLNVGSGETITLSGDLLYESITIDGTVRVTALGEGSGYLRLRASSVSIGASCVVDANAAGYRGGAAPMGGGEGHNDNSGAGQTPVSMDDNIPLPGGGGSHIAPGGPGRTLGCSLVDGAFSGVVYDDAANPLGILGLGSSGGSSYAGTPNNGAMQPGGNGGGVIIIEAETMDLAGQLWANGEDASALQGTAPGGGAGGTVWLRLGALNLTAGAVISARGGSGATQTLPTPGKPKIEVVLTDYKPAVIAEHGSQQRHANIHPIAHLAEVGGAGVTVDLEADLANTGQRMHHDHFFLRLFHHLWGNAVIIFDLFILG